MIELDFNEPLRDLNGNAVGDHKISLALIERCEDSLEPVNPRKAMGWAKALGRGEKLQLDEADFFNLEEAWKAVRGRVKNKYYVAIEEVILKASENLKEK